jgi:hypothetical protein
VRVRRAEELKSWVLIRVESGGLDSGEWDLETCGGGLSHSSSRFVRSSVPRILEGAREVVMREGAWIVLYAVVASRPAYVWITAGLLVGVVRRADGLTCCSSWM